MPHPSLCLLALAAAPVADVAPPSDVEQARFGGLLGARCDATATNLLLAKDESALLDGFRHRPGKHPWIGEHVGKFLHAATLAWRYTGDVRLREKVDRVTAELLRCQLDDGYLGTYQPADYWTSWDVWSHKYCLYGLLTVHQQTGNQAALTGARRIGDLLCRTFGPGRRDIIASGTHVGMAATSVLEPLAMLYAATGEASYLEFCRYLVASWSQPHGPRILEALLDSGKVHRTANGKAYELMSNLVGLCELYRLTGEARFLTACQRAWDDILANQWYLTGGTSHREHFQADHELPNEGNASENCAQVTWLQLTVELLRLTGEARYAEAAETLIYNHLLGSQKPDVSGVCYYTPLLGAKPYTAQINCCTSSNPRGIFLIPSFAWTATGDRVTAWVHAPGSFRAPVGGTTVTLQQTANYPAAEALRYEVTVERPTPFDLAVRVPAWCPSPGWRLNGEPVTPTTAAGLATLRRTWRTGDTLDVALPMPLEVVRGEHTNAGYVAVRRGPLVYALDARDQTDLPPLPAVGVARDTRPRLVDPPAGTATFDGEQLLALPAVLAGRFAARGPRTVLLRPFASAGWRGGTVRVWQPDETRLAGLEASWSLLLEGRESWSRPGNVDGSVNDGDRQTFRVTFDGRAAPEDWYAVELPQPTRLARAVLVHGRTFHDGGWFDAARGRPRLQVRTAPGGEWTTVTTFETYPATTATDARGLKGGEVFEARFDPVEAVAVRVVGAGACGDNPAQCFSSCAELEAFAP